MKELKNGKVLGKYGYLIYYSNQQKHSELAVINNVSLVGWRVIMNTGIILELYNTDSWQLLLFILDILSSTDSTWRAALA